jgi:hypothetical protein
VGCAASIIRYKSLFFSSFVVAAMAASCFVYFNYKFSRFNFVNFSEWTFYTGDGETFSPKEEAYILLVYSSLQEDADGAITRIRNVKNLPIVAIDLAQNRKPSKDGAIYVTAGINVLLNVVHRFHITRSPSVLLIERQNGFLYKQETLVEEL